MWMGTTEIVSIIIAGISYLTALIGVWINTQIKIKGLEVKITELEKDLKEHKILTNSNYDKLDKKLDSILDKLYDLKNNSR